MWLLSLKKTFRKDWAFVTFSEFVMNIDDTICGFCINVYVK